MKLKHTHLRDAHTQLQEQHMELTEQHRQQTDASAQADVVSELTNEMQQLRQDLAGQRAKTMALQQVSGHSLSAVLQPWSSNKRLLQILLYPMLSCQG